MRYFRAYLQLLVIGIAIGLSAPVFAQGGTAARHAYQSLLSRERSLTASGKTPAPAQVRRLVDHYADFAGRYARSGYADNALWQGARLAGMLGDRLGREPDRATGRRLLKNLINGYPSSSLIAEARAALRDLSAPLPRKATTRTAEATAPRPTPRPSSPEPEAQPASVDATPAAAMRSASEPLPIASAVPAPTPQAPAPFVPASATLREVRRTAMPEVVRVTLELTREITYRDQRLSSPSRVFFDLAGTAPGSDLSDAVLTYPDDVVREIRVGQRPSDVTRVVLNVEGSERYSVFTLYNPYRLVIDIHRSAGAKKPPESSTPTPTIATDVDGDPTTVDVPRPAPPPLRPRPLVIPSSEAEAIDTPEPPAPRAPPSAEANASGSFSMARQLGLNVSRIVIDPGHGGHDPGALGSKVTEAEIVLDIALRLEKLLRKHPVFDVVLTRRTDVFIPLEERTAIANRKRADLFLSIHANASRNTNARGVETYFLNFASNPEAAAVAARENASSGRSMHQLGDIVRAIALNNKLDESREFARIVQTSLARKLRDDDVDVRDLGVKQAPFVVLIGASMPSVLAEISFVSNPKDAQLLRNGNHRQKIAESLYEAVVKYQRTLKATDTVALQ